MHNGFRKISLFVRCTSTLALGARACGISPLLLLSRPMTTMQDNRSSTSEARISKLALTFAETARCWLMFRYINLQIEVTSSPSVIRMIFSLKSRSWLKVNAAVRLALGEGDACDQGAECVQTIPPRLRTRRTHAPALAVGIGVAGFTYTWRW